VDDYEARRFLPERNQRQRPLKNRESPAGAADRSHQGQDQHL
jgi:hypothetical protein